MLKRLPVPIDRRPLTSRVAVVLLALGLTMTSATEVVTCAQPRTALNIRSAIPAWCRFAMARFGPCAHAAALLQRTDARSVFRTNRCRRPIVTVIAAAFGSLILRRRGVYFA
jgi:hypothetical protein